MNILKNEQIKIETIFIDKNDSVKQFVLNFAHFMYFNIFRNFRFRIIFVFVIFLYLNIPCFL